MIYLFGTVLIISVSALIYTDVREFRLPNILTLPLIGVGLLQAFMIDQDIINGLIGAAVGYGAFVAIEYGFKAVTAQDGLGRGDAKLLAAGGAWCGWALLPYIVLISSLSAIIAVLIWQKIRQHQQGWIPFGAFLAPGILIIWIAKQAAFLPL